jgi:hypothetical protein
MRGKEEALMAEEVGASYDMHFEAGFKELEVVAYISDFKIVGVAHFGATGRTSSRRPSDYIRQFNDARLTLSQVRIYGRNGQELLDTSPFIVLNMDKVDFIYAREEDAKGTSPA